jgi:hypothetical protein
MLNSTLLTSAKKVMASASPANFVISARFINSDPAATFSFSPLKIDEIIIDRDYIANYTDEIDLMMTISPHDYALLQDQGQNLMCVMTITYALPSGKLIYDPKPVLIQYKAVINDPRDVRKAIPDIQNYKDPSTPISIRLFEPSIYNLRHTKINSIYQNATVSEALHAITQSLGIERLHMVPLDNTHRYDHIDIASYQAIDSVYGYMHSKYGMYEKGATSYLTGGCLYVYPAFETAPVYDKTVIFYQVPTGDFTGSHVFHRIENNSISIVVNSQPESYDLSIAGSENIGTGFIFTRASRMTDGFTAIDSKDGAKFTEMPSLSISLTSSRTMSKDAHNIFHIKATDNPYPSMSLLASHQASLMEVVWMNADPFQLDPGHAVSYHYDLNETMVKKTGIVERARFRIVCGERINDKYLFAAVGTLLLRLSPNETRVI